jgi:tRNA modification GTPase
VAADARPDEREGPKLTDHPAPHADTIFALSSGAPPAAIAVVRISGPRADAALQGLTGKLPEPRRASVTDLHDGAGELLDRALVLRFPGPNSATGEDLTELHLHGGRSVVAGVLAALGAVEGLRAALPGEFTRRAFDNGRIDLAEAEGLADLLEAETLAQRRAALALAGGALSRRIEQWQARLLALAAQVEAALDFSDEGDVEALPAGFAASVAGLGDEWRAQLARPPVERLRDGVRVVIAGPPNAGKSSLLNALVGREAAITSPLAGTTRDLVEAPVAIGGAPFLLVDTAGLRDDGDDPVETIGVARARGQIDAADLLLWLGAPDHCPNHAGAVIVHSKADIVAAPEGALFAVSAVTGEGIDALIRHLIQRSTSILPGEGEVALNARHRSLLAEAVAALDEAGRSADPLIVAESIRFARGALDRITGRAGVEDMLDSLFGRFCIGK